MTDYRAVVNWTYWHTSSKSGEAPPDPLTVQAGESLTLDASAEGNYPGDEYPYGYIAYTIEGPGEVVARNESYRPGGLDGSEDCSTLHSENGKARGSCELKFSEPGEYVVRLAFHSEDPNYLNGEGEIANVEVTG